jgi:O-antigen/teichoic acid export membrane protein
MSLLLLLLGHFFSSAIVGQFFLAFSLLAMPMTLIGSSVSKVFFPQATEANRESKLDALSSELYFKLLFLAFTPIVLVVLVAPELFGWIFGTKWVQAGDYTKWFSLWIVFQFASSPISSCFDVLLRQKLHLMFNICLFTGWLAAPIIGGFFNSPLLAIQLIGILGAILYLGYGIIILYISGNKISKILLTLFKTIYKSLPFVLVPLFIKLLNLSPLFVLVSCIISFILFFLYLSRNRNILIIKPRNV